MSGDVMWKVSELMSPDPVLVGLDDDAAHCKALFSEHGFRHLLVVNAVGHLAGYVADAATAARPEGTVRELIEPVDVSVRPGSPAIEALRALVDTAGEFGAVVDKGRRPVGIVTEHDLMAVAADVLHPDLRASGCSTANVIAARVTETAGSALRRMVARGLRHLVVIDKQGSLVGVLSWRDMVRAGVQPTTRVPVADVLPHHVVMRLVLDASLRSAAALMDESKIGALPIVDEHDKVLWLLTRTDVMRALLLELGRSADQGLAAPPS